MAGPTEAERRRIVEHMNADHGDAVLLYARAFAGADTARSARMVDVDGDGMTLEIDGGRARARIVFDAPVPDARAARRVLVDLVDRARRALDTGAVDPAR